MIVEEWEIPAWLEDNRISDEALAEAYDITPNEWRVAIKTAIAAAHFQHGSPLTRKEEKNEGDLYTVKESSVACEVSLILASAKLKSAALVTAAAVLPLLAGVRTPLWVANGGDINVNQLVSLELCGLENIFLLKAEEIAELLMALPLYCPTLLLGYDDVDLINMIQQDGRPLVPISTDVKIYLAQEQFFRRDLLEFALDPTIIEAVPDFKSRFALDAVYASNKWLQDHRADWISRQFIGPGLECFWHFENIDPEFFRVKEIEIAMKE